MMSVEEIHRNLLRALMTVVESHAAVLANPVPGHEPVLREIELKRLKAQVTVAEVMCRAAGISAGMIQTVMEIRYAEMGAVPA